MAKTYEKMIQTKTIKPRAWNRESLVRFMENKTGFRSLPAYSLADLSPESLAQGERKGWAIPDECFGGKVDESMKNSVRAFIRDKILPFLDAHQAVSISPDEVMLSLQRNRAGQNIVMVYRIKRAC